MKFVKLMNGLPWCEILWQQEMTPYFFSKWVLNLQGTKSCVWTRFNTRYFAEGTGFAWSLATFTSVFLLTTHFTSQGWRSGTGVVMLSAKQCSGRNHQTRLKPLTTNLEFSKLFLLFNQDSVFLHKLYTPSFVMKSLSRIQQFTFYTS